MGLPDDDAVAGSLAQRSISRVVQQLKSQSNLAVLLVNTDRRDEAEPIYREVLAARRRTLGEEHADTLRSMHNLARCRYDQAQAARARRQAPAVRARRAPLHGRPRRRCTAPPY